MTKLLGVHSPADTQGCFVIYLFRDRYSSVAYREAFNDSIDERDLFKKVQAITYILNTWFVTITFHRHLPCIYQAIMYTRIFQLCINYIQLKYMVCYDYFPQTLTMYTCISSHYVH